MSQPVFLKIYHSGKLMTNRQFVSDQISIGSSADGPSVTLADPSVCFWHALIEKRGGAYHISDLGSPNGTFVNTQPILESALKHGDQIQIGDFVIQFFIGVPFARPQAGAKPVSPAKAVQKETVAKAPVQKAPISSSGPVAGSGLVSVDQKKPVEHASLSNVPVSGPDQPEELVVDENPIPLFAHVSEEEDISSPAKDGAPASVPSPAQQGSAPPSVPSPAQQGSAVSPPVPSTVKDSLSLSGALSKADDSTAPVLQKIEETYPEPILHPEPVKQSRKATPAPETAKAEQAPQVEPVPSVEPVLQTEPSPPVKPAPRAEPVLQAEPAKPAPRAEPVLQAEPAPRAEPVLQAEPAPQAKPAEPLSATVSDEPVGSSAEFLLKEPVSAKPAPKPAPQRAPSAPLVSKATQQPAPDLEVAPPPSVSDPVSQGKDSSPILKQLSKGTYAPESEIKDLNSYLSPGNGPVVEIIVAWKERILSVHHFESSAKEITIGSDPKADIHCPNLSGTPLYTLLDIKKNPSVFISKGIQVSLRDHKNQYSAEKLSQQGLITTYGSRQVLSLNQGQLICLNFASALNVYIRYANRVQKALATGLFNFNFSEMMGIMMSFFFMSMLIFYVAIFSPQFLDSKEDLEEADIKKATIEFKQKKRVVKLQMTNKAQKKKTKLSIPNKSKKIKKTKKVGIKKPGKEGRLGQVAAKPKAKSKKKTVTSARSGRSVHTKAKKAGAGPKSPRPDPTKVGLLGVFGKKGTQKVLDKAYSGTGELAGLADQATGQAGQKEAWTGEGIGTRFKNKGAGGKGSALIGVSSGIKTKGRGGGARGYGRGGSLGQRGMVQLSLGTSDWDVAGGVDKNAILRVIRRNKHQLEWCYEFALQKRPDMEGKVLLKWDILNERVKGVTVMNNTTRDSALARCLMSRLKNFRFTGTGLQKGQIGEVRIPFAVTKR